ncbi:MAG: hypothetical protein IB618_02170 [Candidatus Pacearchaeota archaeon]|nr:MAG: hypothetical protein IB618_02170 [Candidatus Pacearchaeota archaeon]
MKNKKAAFEMSITTIIIIVIGVVMLIFGMVFVRTIMCGALNIAATTLEGAQGEINKLFGEQAGEEVVCMGTKGTMDIIPNRYNVVGCGFSPDINKDFEYTFTIESAFIVGTNQDIKNEVKTWIPETLTGTVKAGPGETSYATFGIHPPKDAQHAIIVIKPTINGVDKTKMRFEVRRVGWLQQTVC